MALPAGSACRFFISILKECPMLQFRLARIGLLLAAIGLNAAPALIGTGAVVHAANEATALRPEIGKPLQAAQALIKAKKYKAALAKVREADAVSGKSAHEVFTIEQMRAAAAAGAGDHATAAKAYEAVVESGRLSAGDQLKYVQALASMYYQARDYPKAITWLNRYFKEGGNDGAMRDVLIQAYYLSGDFGRAGKEVQAQIRADERAGRTPPEQHLQLWANVAAKQNDKAAYVQAMEKLVAYYPKNEYWADLLNRVQTKPGYSERLSLDLLRLKLAAGQLTTTADYMEMAQLALQAGFAAEAVKVVEHGYKSGALGSGQDAERHKRLRDLANRKAVESAQTRNQREEQAIAEQDGGTLIDLGYAYVTAGQADKGLQLVEQGLKLGGFKRPDDARLHAGLAYLQAGRKADAMRTLKSVQGKDGTADLARYWVMLANRPA
jgi:hypothetical protein